MEKPNRDQNLKRSRKWAILAAALILAAVAGGIAYFAPQRDPGSEQAASHGGKYRVAPLFDLQDASGKPHPLRDLKGNAVVLHFWASWCPPCLEELGAWVKFAEQFQGQRVKFVAISLDDRWEDAHKILPSKDLPENVTSLLDLSKEVPEKYGTYQYPETYLIGPDLTIITKWVGPQGWEKEGLKDLIGKIAASGKP